MSVEQNKEIVRRWVEAAWNNGDFSAIEELYPPSYVLHFGSTPDVHGAHGLAGFIQMYRSALPDLHMSIEEMIADGEKVVWRVKTTGTHLGEFLGIPPTGNRVSIPAIIITRFEGGKWMEDSVVNDDMGLFQQLGIIPALGQAEAVA